MTPAPGSECLRVTRLSISAPLLPHSYRTFPLGLLCLWMPLQAWRIAMALLLRIFVEPRRGALDRHGPTSFFVAPGKFGAGLPRSTYTHIDFNRYFGTLTMDAADGLVCRVDDSLTPFPSQRVVSCLVSPSDSHRERHASSPPLPRRRIGTCAGAPSLTSAASGKSGWIVRWMHDRGTQRPVSALVWPEVYEVLEKRPYSEETSRPCPVCLCGSATGAALTPLLWLAHSSLLS